MKKILLFLLFFIWSIAGYAADTEISDTIANEYIKYIQDTINQNIKYNGNNKSTEATVTFTVLRLLLLATELLSKLTSLFHLVQNGTIKPSKRNLPDINFPHFLKI